MIDKYSTVTACIHVVILSLLLKRVVGYYEFSHHNPLLIVLFLFSSGGRSVCAGKFLTSQCLCKLVVKLNQVLETRMGFLPFAVVLTVSLPTRTSEHNRRSGDGQ